MVILFRESGVVPWFSLLFADAAPYSMCSFLIYFTSGDELSCLWNFVLYINCRSSVKCLSYEGVAF